MTPETYQWLQKVIDSCATHEHIECCKAMLERAETIYGWGTEIADCGRMLAEKAVVLAEASETISIAVSDAAHRPTL